MLGTTLARIAGGRHLLLAVATAASLAAPSIVRAQGSQAKLTPQLDSARAGLEKYQDPMVAVANGSSGPVPGVAAIPGTGPVAPGGNPDPGTGPPPLSPAVPSGSSVRWTCVMRSP